MQESGRWFDEALKVRGWQSDDRSVQRLLDHLARKTGSESSRRNYLETLARLCKKEGWASRTVSYVALD